VYKDTKRRPAFCLHYGLQETRDEKAVGLASPLLSTLYSPVGGQGYPLVVLTIALDISLTAARPLDHFPYEECQSYALVMDEELSGNAFKRFMRRRGLSREQRGDENQGAGRADTSNDRLQRTPSRHQTDHQPLPHRTSSSHATPRASASNRGASGATAADADSIRRTQSTFESTHPQSPRRPRGEEEEPSKKQYRCEYCNVQFGRKHHKERHVANIHRQVSCLQSSFCDADNDECSLDF